MQGWTVAYFHGHGVRLDEQWLELDDGGRYAIADLRNFQYIKWPVCRLRLAGLLGGIAFPLAGLVSVAPSSLPLWGLVVLGSGSMFGLAWASRWFHPRRYAIWAVTGGRTVELFHTTDPTAWNQLGRALMRVKSMQLRRKHSADIPHR